MEEPEEWEVWDKEYFGNDMAEVVFGGTKAECNKYIAKQNNPARFYAEKIS